MKLPYLVLMACFLSGCYMSDVNLPRPKAEYGQRSEQTIAVRARSGFRKPGVHHVPRGTTLRQFLEIAQILPDRQWGYADYYCGCRVRQMHDGKPSGFTANAKPSEKQLDTRLADGAEVSVFEWNY